MIFESKISEISAPPFPSCLISYKLLVLEGSSLASSVLPPPDTPTQHWISSDPLHAHQALTDSPTVEHVTKTCQLEFPSRDF